MKLLFAMVLMFSVPLLAQNGATVNPAPVASVPTPAPVAAPVAPSLPAPAVVAPSPVDAILVPPQFLKDAVGVVLKLPVVGPIMVKVLMWLGVIVSILTALCMAALSIVMALSRVLSWGGLAQAALFVSSFQSGKIMYWLKYLSAFNAPQDPPKPNA